MAEHEKESRKNKEARLDSLEAAKESENRKEAIRASLDKAEKDHHEREAQEKVLAKATELAQEADKEKDEKKHSEPSEQLRRAPSKKQRRESFDSQIKEVQGELSLSSRMMSKLVHNTVVERVSDIASSTVARPNAMLSGSIAAFISITALYFVARYYGYHLSGFETVLTFALGWIVGILYDYFKTLLGSHDQ